MRVFQSDQVGQGNGRDANTAKRSRHAIGKQTYKTGKQGRKAKADQHAGRDRDCCTKTGHSFHEPAKTPCHKQDKQTLVVGDRRHHLLDDIHRSGTNGQIISENRSDDDDNDRPQGHQDPFEPGCQSVHERQLPYEHGQQEGDDH